MPRVKPSKQLVVNWAQVQGGQTGIIIEESGRVVTDVSGAIKIHKKFIHSDSMEAPYADARMWDAVARMLVAVPPCCAVYPEFFQGDQPGGFPRLLVAFNRTVSKAGRDAITKVWDEIKRVRDLDLEHQHNALPKLLSMVMNMNEYKISNSLLKISEYLLRVLRKEESSSDEGISVSLLGYVTGLESEFKKLFEVVQTYAHSVRDKRNHFNEKAELELDSKVLQELINEVWAREFSQYDQYFSRAGSGAGEFSYTIMKLNIIIGELVGRISRHVYERSDEVSAEVLVLKEQDAELQKQYKKFCDGFSRAMQDVRKVAKHLSDDLSGMKIQFVSNLSNIHAELDILLYKMLEKLGCQPEKFVQNTDFLRYFVSQSSGEFVESKNLLERPLGVSKLSCEGCYVVFKMLELQQWIRGGHGIFHCDWVRLNGILVMLRW